MGLLLSTGIVAFLTWRLSPDAFLTWGWRIPFLASAVLVLLGLWVRAGVKESDEFLERVKNTDSTAKRTLPVLTALTRYPVQIAQIIGLRLIELLTMYIVTTLRSRTPPKPWAWRARRC